LQMTVCILLKTDSLYKGIYDKEDSVTLIYMVYIIMIYQYK